MLIGKPNLESKGLEAWRLPLKQFTPIGRAYELGPMMALMTTPSHNSLNELPAGIGKFERDFAAYDARAGRPFPEGWTIQKLLPTSHLADMR